MVEARGLTVLAPRCDPAVAQQHMDRETVWAPTKATSIADVANTTAHNAA